MASEAPSTERDGNRWALLYITAPTLDPTVDHQVSFLDGHVRAFAHIGGIPARLAYDNLRPAVTRILVGCERALTPRFAGLASHYLF